MELHFPIILDGATGTQLQLRGYAGGISAEQWVLEHPEAIEDLHSKYIEAGSQVVYAPTFGANRVKLEESGVFNQVSEYNHRLVEIAKKNADGRALVAGDISSTGKILAPLGDTRFEELYEIYLEQAEALEDAGVDLFVIETMMSVPEARAALLAVKSVSSKPVFVSFTCNENGRTVMGTDPAAALVLFQRMGVDIFGLNCSTGPDQMLKQIRRLNRYAEVPLMAKPNAGLPQIVNGETVYDCPPDEFTALQDEFAAAGVGVFGGCCGTSPDHVRLIAEKAKHGPFVRPEPDFGGKIAVPTEKDLYLLPPDLEIGRIYPCDDLLEDAFDEVDDSDDLIMTIEIKSEDELPDFEDVQFAIPRPLCILCNDAELLEKALRLYQGCAIYAGDLGDEELVPLSRKYGLII